MTDGEVGGPCRERPLDAAGAGELPLLEALLAEDRAALRRPERHRRVLAARRARVCVSTRFEHGGPALTRLARLALHALQRLGSFLNCLSAKKSCSPAVQMNSDPQSTHVKTCPGTPSVATLVVDRRRPPYSVSRRSFLRLRFRASACFARRLSPGFK